MSSRIFKLGPPIRVDLFFEAGKLQRVALGLRQSYSCSWHGEADVAPFLEWLEAYGKKEQFYLNNLLNLHPLPPFHRSVLEELQHIPFGHTLSYSDVALALGNPRAARAVGNACHRNPFPLFVPCHRVVAQGKVGGFAFDGRIKERLLAFEAD